MTLDEFRRAFIAAASQARLELFLSQWLERVGAPRIGVGLTPTADGRTAIVLRQAQPSEPLDQDVEVELVLADGSTRRQRIRLSGRETLTVVETAQPISSVTLDPDRDLPIWRPSYDAGPVVDGISLEPTADWVEPSAYVGTYRIELLGQTVEVTAGDRRLWAHVDGSPRQLSPHLPCRLLTPAM
jgi:hypothetical protein